MRRRLGHGRRRRAVGRRRRARRRRGLGRRRGAVRASPARRARPRSRTSAPTARRSPTSSPASAPATASSGAAAHVRGRRLRLRLPHQPVQGRARALRRPRRRPSSCVSSPTSDADPVRRARPDPRRRGRRPRAARREVRDAVLGAAPRQGDGARRRRPRHVERRLVLHQPGARPPRPRRRCPPTPRAGPRRDGRVKTSAAWLIEHAGVRPRGTAPGPAGRLVQAHPRAHQPRAGDRGRRRRARPRGPRPGPGGLRGRSSSPSPILVGCKLGAG